MTDHEERSQGNLLNIIVNGWKLVRSVAEAAQQRSGPDSATEDAGGAAEAEGPGRKRLRKGAWIVVGASLVWKGARVLAGRSRARSASHAGQKALAQRATESSPAAQPEETHPLETAWHALRDSAAAVGHAVDKALAEAKPVDQLPSTGREADRNLDRENGVNVQRRERWGTLLAGSASIAGVAGGIWFVVTYWTGGPNQWFGDSAAVFLGGFGLAMVLWAHWLTDHKEAVEPRERVSSKPPEREKAAAEFLAGAGDIHRRRLLQWMGLAGAGALGAIIISMIRSLGFPPRFALDTDVWKRGQRLVTVDGIPVSVDSLAPGGMIVVFPENAIGSEKTQTVLVRVHQDLLELPPRRSGWAPGGNLAYSRICTHAGCSVGMYEANTHMLMCPCHQSTFNVLRGAQPTGGPAARPLPQLPLVVDSNGHLRAAGGLSNYPGPGFWEMPE